MLIEITAGPGVGQVIDAIPAVARARLAGGTAKLFRAPSFAPERATAETAMVEPRSHKAVTAAQNPPAKRKR